MLFLARFRTGVMEGTAEQFSWSNSKGFTIICFMNTGRKSTVQIKLKHERMDIYSALTANLVITDKKAAQFEKWPDIKGFCNAIFSSFWFFKNGRQLLVISIPKETLDELNPKTTENKGMVEWNKIMERLTRRNWGKRLDEGKQNSFKQVEHKDWETNGQT